MTETEDKSLLAQQAQIIRAIWEGCKDYPIFSCIIDKINTELDWRITHNLSDNTLNIAMVNSDRVKYLRMTGTIVAVSTPDLGK